MLDIGWWELCVVGMVALLVVGPKELPSMLRTIGRYVGMIKRQADEFRSQFDDALRESEFSDLRDEMDSIKSDVTSSLDDAQESINKELSETNYDWDQDEAIEPAPEIAAEGKTDSFTMADGEVVTKQSSDTPENEPSVAEAASDSSPNNGLAAESSSDSDPTTSNEPVPTSSRDAEAVR